MVATSLGLIRIVYASALCVAASAAVANTNPQFSAQVRGHRSTMAQSESAVGEATRLCATLSASRAMDEPRCVALRLHLRTLSDRKRTETCDTSELSAIAHIRRCFLGGLPDSAA
jgi:hypothetical protein